MIRVDYPKFNFRLKKQDGKEYIFDEIRKRRVRLTPEEWVRQNFIQYLIQIKKYPASLFSVEKEIKLNDLKKRCDIVVFKNAAPWMIVECKAPEVQLTEQTVQQILAYNITLKSKFLVITNGTNIFCFDTSAQQFLNELPEY
jgi:hypothetical protein